MEILENRTMLSASSGTIFSNEQLTSILAPAILPKEGQYGGLTGTGLEEKIQSQLWATVERIEQAHKSSAASLEAPSADLAAIDLTNISTARVDESGAIQVYAELNSFEPTALQSIEALGLKIVSSNESYGAIEAWAPYDKVDDLAALAAVKLVRLPVYPVFRTGSVNSAGDGIVNADDVRSKFATYGIDGSGVRVGVISDGVQNRSQIQGGSSPDLPAITVNPARTGSGDEGTAMLEIIHDLAPGADLYFSSAAGGALAMIDSINWLVDQGVNVIVDDVGIYDEHYFSDSTVAQAVSSAIASGVTYITAAGNDGQLHYQGQWSPANGLQDFDPGSGVNNTFLVGTVPVGGIIDVFLQWSDPWDASANDYNLSLRNLQTQATIVTSLNPQTGTQHPFENVHWTNNTGAPVDVGLVIDDFNNPLSRELELFVHPKNFQLTNGVVDQNRLDYDSIFGHAAVEAAITVGAINAGDSGNDTVAAYSSRGTSTIVTNFSTQSKTSRLSIDGASIDGVQTRIGQLGSFQQNPFFGTSAAAPHVAAIAALMLDVAPTLTPAQVSDILQSTAVDVEVNGYDSVAGAGRFDALSAVYKAFTPSTPLLPFAFNSGSLSDTITNINTPTITGFVPANSFVQLYIDNVADGTYQAAGTAYSIPIGPLSNGLHTFKIKVAANSSVPIANYSNFSPDLSVTIDTGLPTAPGSLNLQTASDSGSNTADNLTNDTTPTFDWLASSDGTGSGVSGYYYAVDDNTPESGGAFIMALAATLSVPGNSGHTIYVRAVDVAGNLSSVASLPFTVDTIGPKISDVIVSSSTANQMYHPPYDFATATYNSQSVDGSGNQLRTVPVGGADTIQILFNEGMDSSSISATSLTLTGLAIGNSVSNMPTLVTGYPAYDSNSHIATWRYVSPLHTDEFLISLSDSVTDAAGNQMDGEWTNPFSTATSGTAGVSQFPSGNGTPGGAFNFVFTIMSGDTNQSNVVDYFDHFIWQSNSGGSNKNFSQGDFNGDGSVNSTDESMLNANMNRSFSWLIYADFNHDGVVDGADLAIWQANYGASDTEHQYGDANMDTWVDGLDFEIWNRQQGLALRWVA